MYPRTIALILLIVLFSIWSPARSSLAAQHEQPQFSLLPVADVNSAITEKGYFVYQTLPDTEVVGQVLVQNSGNQPLTVMLAAVDARTAQNGGVVFTAVDDPPEAIARWIQLEQTSVTLAPRTQQAVSFSVRTPAAIDPGQYLAGIAAYIPDAPAAEAANEVAQIGPVINVRQRYVVAVEIDIQGEWLSHLSIAGAELLAYPSGTYIGVQLHNDGDTLLKPAGTLTLYNAAGEQILAEPIVMHTFVTGTSATYPVPWPGIPAAGAYSVAIELSFAHGATATYAGVIEISPATAAQSAEAQRELPSSGVSAGGLPAGVQPWLLYGIAGLLLLVVVLLALNLARGRGAAVR